LSSCAAAGLGGQGLLSCGAADLPWSDWVGRSAELKRRSGAAFVLKRGTDKAVRSAFAAVREDDVRCQKWLCGEKAVRGAPSKSNTIVYFFSKK